MKHVDQPEFLVDTAADVHNYWIPVSEADLVYEGEYVIPAEDDVWITVTLDRPFLYDGVTNLMIAVFDNTDYYFGYEYRTYYRHSLVDTHRTLFKRLSHEGLNHFDPITDSFTFSNLSGGITYMYGQTHEGQWPYLSYEDTPFLACLKLDMVLATGPVVEVVPNPIDMGDAPNGYWKHPLEVTINNNGLAGTLQDVSVSGSYFSLEGQATPTDMPFGAEFTYQLSQGIASPGIVNEELSVTYSDNREQVVVPVTANAYNAVCPDVYELAQEVTAYPYQHAPTQLHNTYQLPGENEDGLDAVYHLTFANDVLLSANVANGANPKLALYAEDFNGGEGPHHDNAYEGPQLQGAPEPISEWLYCDDGVLQTNVGNGGTPMSWGVMFPVAQLADYQGCILDKIRIFDRYSGEVTLNVYMDGENSPRQKVATQVFQFTSTGSTGTWKTVELDAPVYLDVTKNLWVCFHTDNIAYPASACSYCGDPNSCWYTIDDENWATLYENDMEYSWMIRAFVTNESGSRELRTDGSISAMTVEAGTYYLVASSTEPGFQVNINAETIPLPQAAINPIPADAATGVVSPLRLQWDFGERTTSYRLLFGTANPPQEVVVDWTNELDNKYITGLLSNNTRYYWRVDERNSSGDTYGEVWQFTTSLNVPRDLMVENDQLYLGDTAVLQWAAPTDRSFLGYNVYQNNVLIGNTTEPNYRIGGLPYNMTGYQFAVTAVYDVGESAMTEAVKVKVTGEGSISGSVVEQDRTTPIENVRIKVTGVDEFGVTQRYQFYTDENGHYEGELLAGTYVVAALKNGYQNAVYPSEVTVHYQAETASIGFVMNEKYYTVEEVVAEDVGDKAKITWSGEASVQEPQWLYYDNGTYYTSVGWGSFHWGISFDDMSAYSGMKLTKISYFDVSGFNGTITANIYLGGTTSPQLLVSSQTFSVDGAGKFMEVELANPVEIDGTESLWITCFCDNMNFPGSCCPNTGDAHGRWISQDGTTWVDLVSTNSSLNYTWMLRGYLEDENGKGRELQSYNLYRSGCYGEPAAVLVAENLVDTVYMDEAWDAFETGVYKWGVSRIYQGNREERALSTLLQEDFEGGVIPEGWTRYGGDWPWKVAGACENNTSIGPHDGNYAAFCNSDGESGTRYLVTPELDLSTATTASLNFYYILPDWGGDWDDLYVKYGTSETGPWTELWRAPADTWNWTEMTIDLSALCGGTYYLSFVGVDAYGYCSAIDDVTVTADVIPSGFDLQTLVSEGFEDSAIPLNWSQYGGSWNWSFTNAFAENIGIGPHSGSRAAYCNSDGESGTRNLVTPAIDLSVATSATLDFWYVLPDWGGDWDDLYVKYSTSPTGPWTTLWTAPSDTWTWTEQTIDLSALCGGVIYLDFVENDWWGYGAAIDDVTVTALTPLANQPHESEVVWSNCLDKDMLTSVDVTVRLNNALSPEGTRVAFISLSEPGLGNDVEVTLDETGYVAWDEFRKGTYLHAIWLPGYESCANYDTIEITSPVSIDCLLEEQLYSIEDLYVSPTGWAQWSGAFNGVDEFYYDFEDETMDEWTLIDADGDGINWKLGMMYGDVGIVGHNSTCCVYSESYVPEIGGIYPDNYLVSKRVGIGENSVFSFYACAQDEWYDTDHYGVAISTLGNTNPADFTTIWEETLHFKSGSESSAGPKGSRIQGRWWYKEIDLSAYAGQQVYIAIRHFDCYDAFCVDVDDIRLRNGGSTKAPMSYKLLLDGVYAGEAANACFQYDVATLVPGQTYTASVAAVFATGMSDWVSYDWTYVPCEEFEGADNLSLEVEEDVVTLHWTLPEWKQEGSRDGQWYYYDNGEYYRSVGNEAGVPIYWAIRLPMGEYAGNRLTKVSMYDPAGFGHQGTIMIYQGGATAPETLVYSQPYQTMGIDGFAVFELEEPVAVDETKSLWIVMNNTTGTFVAPVSDDTWVDFNDNGRWISTDGVTWEDSWSSLQSRNNWMLRAYLETENVDGVLGTMVWRDGELLTQTPIQGNTYSDEDVTADWHEYCVRVVHNGMPDSTYYAMSCPLCEMADVTGVGEDLEDVVRIYPNPTNGELTIKAEGVKWIRIVDMLGRKVYDQAVEGDEKTLNLSGFGSGVYLVNITTEKGVINRRIVVYD